MLRGKTARTSANVEAGGAARGKAEASPEELAVGRVDNKSGMQVLNGRMLCSVSSVTVGYLRRLRKRRVYGRQRRILA